MLSDQVQRIDVHLGDDARVDSDAAELLATAHRRLAARGGRRAVVGVTDLVRTSSGAGGLSGLLRST